MIRGQQEPYREFQEEQSEVASSVALGAQILHTALAFDQLAAAGNEPSSVLATMRERAEYDPRLLESLAKLDPVDPGMEIERVGSFIGRRRSGAQGGAELPLTSLATQVWDLLNDQSETAPRSQLQPNSDRAPSEHKMARPPNEVMEDLLTFLNEQFDALYLALSASEERVRLLEAYVLARDAFCETAGKAFDRQREAAACLAEKLDRALVRMHESSGPSQSPLQSLNAFATAADLSTQLASLADERPKAGCWGPPALGVHSERNHQWDI